MFPSIFSNPVDTIINGVCSYFINHPDRAQIAIQKLNETLEATADSRQTFVLTIAYINQPANQLKLITNTTTCKSCLSDIKNDLVQDWSNRNMSSNNAEQNALNMLINFQNTAIGR